jgi:hypothetical protein
MGWRVVREMTERERELFLPGRYTEPWSFIRARQRFRSASRRRACRSRRAQRGRGTEISRLTSSIGGIEAGPRTVPALPDLAALTGKAESIFGSAIGGHQVANMSDSGMIKRLGKSCDLRRFSARPEGFEPSTLGFGGQYSIQLSYGRRVTVDRSGGGKGSIEGAAGARIVPQMVDGSQTEIWEPSLSRLPCRPCPPGPLMDDAAATGSSARRRYQLPLVSSNSASMTSPLRSPPALSLFGAPLAPGVGPPPPVPAFS